MNFCDIKIEELTKWLKERGYPTYFARSIFEWVYRKRILSFEAMTNLPKTLREELRVFFCLPSISLIRVADSQDGETFKSLWQLSDGKRVESVLICAPGRRTLCVSSQVGCPARCAFCASGREGLIRNLTPGEIVEQVLFQKDLTNIVYMGMGEPLENYDAVVESVRILTSQVGFSKRRITISTVGVLPGIERLAKEDLGVNLVLSLHAPNQHIRKKIIPYARKYELSTILEAMDAYAKETKRDITFEYTLLSGINDQVEHAEELATLLSKRQCTVNLIPYNPVIGLRLERPSSKTIADFRAILERRGIIHTCRYTKGDDIAAACGQLSLVG